MFYRRSVMDKYTKEIVIGLLTGILICLAIIASKPSLESINVPAASVELNESSKPIQIAPNRIGIMADKSVIGDRDVLLIFDYNEKTKSFEYKGNIDFDEYMGQPEKYGIPTQE
jgi:hypothetical protein